MDTVFGAALHHIEMAGRCLTELKTPRHSHGHFCLACADATNYGVSVGLRHEVWLVPKKNFLN